MTPEQIEQIRWMRSMPHSLEFDTTRIDAAEGVLYDVVMCEEGEAKGHGVYLEEEFITDLVAYDQKHFNKSGLKNRFDHPGGCDGTMGTQMGRFKNFRTRKKGGKMQAIADLYLLDAADLSPTKPNMKSWMLQMAQEDPGFIMQSIVFKPGRYYQKFKNGDKRYIWEYQEDDNGGMDWVSSDPTLGKIFVEFGPNGEHYYTDTVEAGAATDNLFSTEANPHLFVSKALSWLEDNPKLKEFAQANPEKVFAFLKQLGLEPTPPVKPQPQKMSLLKKLFGQDPITEDVLMSAEEIKELRTKLGKAEEILTSLQTKFDKLQSEYDALKKDLETRTNELSSAQDKIKELEAKPAAPHTDGPTDTPVSELRSYHKDPITQRAIERFKAKPTK